MLIAHYAAFLQTIYTPSYILPVHRYGMEHATSASYNTFGR